MMSLRRIFGLMLLFLFFEAVVAFVTMFGWPDASPFMACLGMTGLAVGVCVVILLIGRLTSRPRAAQAATAARPAATPVKASAGDGNFAQEFISLLKEADRRLASVLPPNGKPPKTTSLPLYLMIGAEDSGKTSAILNSGVDATLLAGESSREGRVLPTRVCNLWLAEKSLLADFSGRLLMQEAEHWEQSLRMLGGERAVSKWKRLFVTPPAPPTLRGVMLFCDANTLVRSGDPARAAAFARTMNERLQTAGSVFRNEFPVYVVFNKADSVQDFGEFFSRLNDAEERQVLGATLRIARGNRDAAEKTSEAEGKRLTGYFNRLCLSLADKRIALLPREDDTKRRAKAYEFPREMRKTRADSVRFLLDVFRPSSAQQRFRLRGFYFAGQRQVSRSRVVADAGSTEFFSAPNRLDATGFLDAKASQQMDSSLSLRGMPNTATVSRPVFLNELFRNVLLKDRTSYTAAPPDTRDQTRRHLVFGSVGTVFLILSLLVANAWRQNQRLLNAVRTSIDEVQRYPSSAPTFDNLVRLDHLRGSLVRLQQYERDGAPWSYRWGLYAGNKILPAANQLYLDRFRRTFAEPVLAAWATHFRSLRPNTLADEDVYGLLKSYRMVTSQTCKPDEAFLNPSLMTAWSAVVQPSSEVSAVAQRQVEFYSSELKLHDPFGGQLAEDGAAVKQAQEYLRSMNGPEKIFRGLMEQVNREGQRDNLGNYAANYRDVLNGPDAVDPAYTRSGWNAMIERINSRKFTSAGDPCVVGGGSSGLSSLSVDAGMQRDVQNLYVRDYVAYWKSFLSSHHVVAFSGIPDGTRKLHTLADNNRSPLLALVYMTSHNTDVASSQPAETRVGEVVEQVRNTARARLGGVLDRLGGKKQTPEGTGGPVKDAWASYGDVATAFGPVHAMVDPAAPDKWLNERNQEYIQALELLSESLAALPARPDLKVQADEDAILAANKAELNAEKALHTLTESFVRTRSQVDVNLTSLLDEPIRYSGDLLKHLPTPLPQVTPYTASDTFATSRPAAPAASPAAAPQPPAAPAPDTTIPIKAQVNQSAQALCSSLNSLRTKYPFDQLSTEEASVQDLNLVFAPVTGTLAEFVHTPDVSKVYQQQGRAWVANPAFAATYSQPFLTSLNNLQQFSDELYADGGSNPHFEYTVSLDGTGKVPFQLDVDGHVLHYNPKKPTAPVRLQWPPLTAAQPTLVLNGMHLPAQSAGPWSFFQLLQEADEQNGTLYIFRTLQFAGSKHQRVEDSKGNPVTIQIRFDSPVANIFMRGYFSRMHCEGWVVR